MFIFSIIALIIIYFFIGVIISDILITLEFEIDLTDQYMIIIFWPPILITVLLYKLHKIVYKLLIRGERV